MTFGITPPRRVFVFFAAKEAGLPPYAEQLAHFKDENAVGPQDTLCTVTFHFDT